MTLKRITPLLYLWLLSVGQCLGQITSCPGYNYNPPSVSWGNEGTIEHIGNGEHNGAATLSGSCAYTSINQTYCATACSADAFAAIADYGEVEGTLYVHEVTSNNSPGFANTPGGAAACGSTAAWTATSCFLSCSIQIGFNATASGIGTTVNFPSSNLSFNTQIPYTQTCPVKDDPTHLNSISVTPINAGIYTVAGGDGAVTSQQFTAIGAYANGASKTLTNAVWTSSNTSIATASSTGLAKATGTSVGTTTITASSGGTSGYATLSVSYNEDGGGGGSGGGCFDDGDCASDECCIENVCTPCHEQGEGTKGSSAAAWRRLQRNITDADRRP